MTICVSTGWSGKDIGQGMRLHADLTMVELRYSIFSFSSGDLMFG